MNLCRILTESTSQVCLFYVHLQGPLLSSNSWPSHHSPLSRTENDGTSPCPQVPSARRMKDLMLQASLLLSPLCSSTRCPKRWPEGLSSWICLEQTWLLGCAGPGTKTRGVWVCPQELSRAFLSQILPVRTGLTSHLLSASLKPVPSPVPERSCGGPRPAIYIEDPQVPDRGEPPWSSSCVFPALLPAPRSSGWPPLTLIQVQSLKKILTLIPILFERQRSSTILYTRDPFLSQTNVTRIKCRIRQMTVTLICFCFVVRLLWDPESQRPRGREAAQRSCALGPDVLPPTPSTMLPAWRLLHSKGQPDIGDKCAQRCLRRFPAVFPHNSRCMSLSLRFLPSQVKLMFLASGDSFRT